MKTISNHKTIIILIGFFTFALTTQSKAVDVREKLIVKVYKCSEFAVDATITRPLMPFEYETYQPPGSRRSYHGGGFGGSGLRSVQPIVGQGSAKGGGGLFTVPSKQGLGGGGGAAPPKPATAQSQAPSTQPAATITYKTKNLTEIMNFIQKTVDPKGWSDGHARPSMQKIGDMLIIKQTQKNHDEIQKLLNMLRNAKKE